MPIAPRPTGPAAVLFAAAVAALLAAGCQGRVAPPPPPAQAGASPTGADAGTTLRTPAATIAAGTNGGAPAAPPDPEPKPDPESEPEPEVSPPPGPVQAPVLLRTLPGSWDEGWLGSPALVDVDGDGALDVVATRGSVLAAWRADGTALWQTAFGHSAGSSPAHGSGRMWSGPVAGDFDGDGKIEIAVGSTWGGSGSGNLAVYDHQGQLLPGWPRSFGDQEIRSITAADVDGDGVFEIIANKLGDGPSTAVLRLNGEMMPGWPQVSASCHPAPPSPPCFDYGGYNQNVGAANLDADALPEVVSTYDMMGFGLFNGDGTPLPAAAEFKDRAVSGVEAYHDYAMARQGWGTGDRSEFTDSPPAIADLDGDGVREVILVGNHETSQSTESRGFTLWVLRPDASRPPGWETPKDTGWPLRSDDPGSNIILTEPAPAVGQLDGNGPLEIVFPGADGQIHAYAANGQKRWTYAFGSAHPYVGATEPLIVDLNGDGAAEVIVATWVSGAPGAPDATPKLLVLGSDGALLHAVPLSGRGAMAPPSVADLDGDGALELVLSLKDSLGGGSGGVQIWSLPQSRTNGIQWGTGRGNPLRTGTRTAP